MLGSLFASKNQKLVKGWVKEHEKIVVLAHKIIAAYSEHDHASVRKYLLELNKVAVVHLMTEDIEFYRLLKDNKRKNDEIEKLVNEFTRSFKETKTTLREFLLKYTLPDAIYDDDFFKTFNIIVEVLADRIGFEENNLYAVMKSR